MSQMKCPLFQSMDSNDGSNDGPKQKSPNNGSNSVQKIDK